MLNIEKNKDLKSLNTFGISALAKNYVKITDATQLKELAKTEEWNLPKLILGGGSNVLFLSNMDGLVIHVQNKGVELISENASMVLLKAQAGENWHQFVLHTLDHGYFGLENLSLIPGCVGASPMQNIGAYGVEIEQVFVELEAFHIPSATFRTFNHAECNFGYRTSVFKTKEKGNYIICSVTFRLSKKPKLNTSYGAIKQTLESKNIKNPTPKDVSNAVIQIRQSKLPNPAEIGNAGSFFKNPVVSREHFLQIQENHPNMPYYEQENGSIKVPAGWLIEQCGWKGKQIGNTGTYDKQALILVNRDNAKGKEIFQLAKDIQKSVVNQFGIELEPEVNMIGS